jgi:hypothetical protein
LIGNGNSSYELGSYLNKYCSKITILGRSIREWAITSHYTGDIRSLYTPLFEGFLLKSLNAFINNTETNKEHKYNIIQKNKDDKYLIGYKCSAEECNILHTCIREEDEYFDHIILCTGWSFDSSNFNFDIDTVLNDKYPSINHRYESTNNNNLFFIGTLMHSLDYKKSSGAFIHGFRYLIKHFFNINFNNQQYDINNFLTIEEIVNHIVLKINVSSPMYQMYGILSDIIVYNKDSFFYINNVPRNFYATDIRRIPDTLFFIISLQYGDKESKLYDLGKRLTSIGYENKSPLLHLVIDVYRIDSHLLINLVDKIHFDEDLYAEFTINSKYKDKIYRTIKMFM